MNAELDALDPDPEGGKKKKKFGAMRWVMSIFFGVMGIYWGAGALAHFVIWPVSPPVDPVQAGDVLRSDYDGVTITVDRIENGFVYGDMVFQGQAVGAPSHIHDEMEVEWTVVAGTVAVTIDDEDLFIGAGKGFVVGAGTPHKIHNPHLGEATIRGKLFPEQHAACLAQVFGWFDESEENRSATRLILQTSLFDAYCDSRYEGAPQWAYVPAITVLAPTARLFGYPPYYERYTLAARRTERAAEEEAVAEEAAEERERRPRRRQRR